MIEKLKYPFAFNPLTKKTWECNEGENIKSSVKTILLTTYKERILNPSVGSRLKDVVFENINYTTMEMIKKEINYALFNQEKRISNVQVSFQSPSQEDGSLVIYISYEVASKVESTQLYLDKEGFHV